MLGVSKWRLSLIEALPAEAARVLEDELEPGERLVWCGQPRAWAFARSAIPIFLFGLVFLGFSIFWECMALMGTSSISKSNGGPPAVFATFFPLFGIPFIIVGLCMVLSP